MKITKEHYAYIKESIEAVSKRTSKKDLEIYKLSLTIDSWVKDTNKRFRWDLFYAAKLIPFACDTLYSYCNDEHIDTALRKIVKELEL